MAKRVKWSGNDELKRLLQPISDIRLDPDNARSHPARNIDAIGKSLKTFRQVKNIVVHKFNGSNNLTVIAGNGTLEAARALGWTHIACVHFVGSDDDARAFAIADNRTTDLSNFDTDRLIAELKVLSSGLDDFSVTGFTEEELELLMESAGDGDDAPPPDPDDPSENGAGPAVSQLGDTWALGEHKILCGDSTDEAQVQQLVAPSTIDLVITDPPYNVAYVGKTEDALTIKNDEMISGAFSEFLSKAFLQMRSALKPGGSFYIFCPAGPQGTAFRTVLDDVMQLRQVLIWVKDQFVLGHSDYHYRHEDILYGWRDGGPHYFKPDRTQNSVWECDRPKASRIHPTMKPLDLIVRAIRNSSVRRGTVFDPFCGSGSTLMACEQTARQCSTIELDPNYVDAAVRRWQQHTGRNATLIGTSKTFDEVDEERSHGR